MQRQGNQKKRNKGFSFVFISQKIFFCIETKRETNSCERGRVTQQTFSSTFFVSNFHFMTTFYDSDSFLIVLQALLITAGLPDGLFQTKNTNLGKFGRQENSGNPTHKWLQCLDAKSSRQHRK
jgi:hypothetical protein